MILHSRAWIPLYDLKTFRKLAGGHWLYVTRDGRKYWEQFPRKMEIPTHIPTLKEKMGLDNVHLNEYYGDEFINCMWAGSVGGVVDSLWKSLRGRTK